jgi:hypothetical protein
MLHPKQLKVAGATLAVAVAGAGAAFAATHGGSSASGTSTATQQATGGPPSAGHGGRLGGGFEADLSAAASYLGTTKAKLQQSLSSGTTLAKIASSTSGKSTNGLIDAIVAADTKRLESADLSAAQRTQMLSMLRQRVTSFVNGIRPAGAPPGGRPRTSG